MENLPKRTWAEIDLDALADNYRAICTAACGTPVMAMVKGDAYGHGAVRVAQVLSRMGVSYFGVATPEEALELRENGIRDPILIMGYTPPAYIGLLVKHDITQTVLDYESAKSYSDAAMVYSKRLKVHVKLDTGMGREGIVCRDRIAEACEEIMQICMLDGLYAEGIFTHLCDATSSETWYTERQIALFGEVIENLEKKNIRFEIKHCANSAAVLKYPCAQFDMVRTGILLYGLTPDASISLPNGCRPVMSLRCSVSQVKTVAAGSDIGYGRTYTTVRPSRIAVLPIGYADGLPRLCSNRLLVSLHGKKVPVTGNVCMDLTMIDVTDLPQAKRGDIVTVFGRDHNTVCTAEDVAAVCGTINYEIVTCIGKRIPRVYVGEA